MKERPIQIVVSDHGDYVSVTVHGQSLPVSQIGIGVVAQGQTVVQLTIPAIYCNIEFDYSAGKGHANEGEAQ